jgi:predicted HD phosphohydrolase
MREQFRDSPFFERTARFCQIYDNPAFDADMEKLSLDEFEPMLRRVFSQPKNSIYKTALE